MNILYLHGLNSKLSAPKRKLLEKYGTVYAPDINYDLKYIQPELILNQFQNIEFNVVIGSSMGALNTYIIAENIGRPALMFNPPLSRYKGVKFQPRFAPISHLHQICLGGIDDIVDPGITLQFLASRITNYQTQLNIDPQLGHRIPMPVFEQEIRTFFSKLCI
jgi:uncharacterized protein